MSQVIHNKGEGCWQILLDSGELLTWDDPDWFNCVDVFGACTITKDDDNNQVETVSFPTKLDAEIAIELRQRYRKFIEDFKAYRAERKLANA